MGAPPPPGESAWEQNDSHEFLEFREQNVSPKSSRDFREKGHRIGKLKSID